MGESDEEAMPVLDQVCKVIINNVKKNRILAMHVSMLTINCASRKSTAVVEWNSMETRAYVLLVKRFCRRNRGFIYGAPKLFQPENFRRVL